MPKSEDRYQRERRASDLAWRMLGLQARSSTICRWTGVTPRRVRRLYHSYFRDLEIAAQRRPRGRAPHCIELLLRSKKQRSEALELARVYHHMGLLKISSVPPSTGDRIRIGETVCDAFETFKGKYPNSRITLEHGVLLLSSMVRAEDVLLHCCSVCQNLIMLDRLQPAPQWCAACSAALEYPPSFESRMAPPRQRRGAAPATTAPPAESWSPRLSQLRRRRQLRTIATITGPQLLRQK